MAFDSLSEKLQEAFQSLKGKGKITEEDVNLALRQVRTALLEADVNFIYGKDYDLGDVVTVKKKKWNTTQNLRITELCEVYEYGGMYVVPTFGDALPTTIKWDE